ncbi:SPOR domain-containing protein [Jannaschia sp. KMU-145]|uniref:SPOR domain-containing protein n=1 Tax=Jannaschia halovivens TaxID=3388667 RepID=UPI00396B20D5
MRQATIGAFAPNPTIRFLTGVALIALVAGCQAANTGGDATRAAPASSSVQLIERDVEAPEVFQAKDRALWDGRPSLGGVWVAAPDVTDPERVIIRNEANGKFVIGALFKRERANPGPPLQLSSDAAAALGVLAGAPTSIDVVALRREEVSEPSPAPAASAPVAVAEAEPAALEEEIVQTAEAPTADAEIGADALDAIGAAAEAERALAADAAERTPAAQPERRLNWFQRMARSRQDRRAAREAAAAELTADAVPTEMNAGILEPPVATAAAAPVTTSAIAATTASGTPTRAPAPVAGIERAYVQIGIFSVEENARNTATALSGAGVVPTVLEESSRGRTFWRVIVGPSTTSSDRAAVIRKAKGLGFTDAFAVRG